MNLNPFIIRKNLITLSLIIACIGAHAQTYTAKDLIGRWEFTRNKKANILFTSDSTGAWLQQDGLIFNRFKYTCGIQGPGDKYMEFRFTVELNRKHPKHVSGYIKFLDDSIALLRIGWPISKGADTTYKKASVLKRIKQPLWRDAPRLPTYKDLLGKWLTYSKKRGISSGIRFIDSTRAVHIIGDRQQLVNYKIDFTQQPIPVDFYWGTQLTQGYIVFYSIDRIRVELFKQGKPRPDHFRVFGQNIQLTRQKGEAGAGSAGN
ncbi:hypothetical protein [Mucilaginibacter panaciglaebae]|uniref:DUF2490 domain-containing protein n=1 Tax=Mucilaginibacter panaciglaebae TaxID=502331 RepID=A0ABP7WEX4_9SPHI